MQLKIVLFPLMKITPTGDLICGSFFQTSRSSRGSIKKIIKRVSPARRRYGYGGLRRIILNICSQNHSPKANSNSSARDRVLVASVFPIAVFSFFALQIQQIEAFELI